MKPPPFDYYAPEALDEALGLLAELGDDAKPLAGGQSLVPLMNFRLAWPSALVDLNRIPGLDTIEVSDGVLRVGATARQADVERSAAVRRHVPLLAEALRYVGHPATRTRGTVCGSVAHADPAAEIPAVLAALGGEVVVQGRNGSRTVGADDFFVGFFTTALEQGELVSEVRFPVAPARSGSVFLEFARRFGDFALAGVAVQVESAESGSVARAGIALCGAGPRPIRAREAEEALAAGETVDEAARLTAQAAEPSGDIHGDANYRRELVGVLTGRALRSALERARSEGNDVRAG